MPLRTPPIPTPIALLLLGSSLAACSGGRAAAAGTADTGEASSADVADSSQLPDLPAGSDTAESDAADSVPPGDAGGRAAEVAEPPPCGPGPPGTEGVGRACLDTRTSKECWGNDLAVTCMVLGPGAPAMCVQYCYGFPGECGDAVCMPRGDLPAVCAPAGCAARYALAAPTSEVTCTTDCTAADPDGTELGVGRPCTTHAQCKAGAAKFCPYVYQPDNFKWCSMLCSEDKDCGKGAICWRRVVIDHGVHFVLGSCAPSACCHPW